MTELATRDRGEMAPHQKVSLATEIATALMGIVDNQELFLQIGRRKHLLAEAWETVIALDNAHPVIEWTTPIDADGRQVIGAEQEIAGYKARAIVVKNGETISSGEMTCGLDEFPTQGAKGFAKHRAAMSAAQTWATAKAGRTKYAWIVTLAGYAPTPADEMPRVDKSDPLFCAEHDTLWFKRGKMRDYGHPLVDEDGKDTDEWCNRPSNKAPQSARENESSSEGALTPEAAENTWNWFIQQYKNASMDFADVKSYLGGETPQQYAERWQLTPAGLWMQIREAKSAGLDVLPGVAFDDANPPAEHAG